MSQIKISVLAQSLIIWGVSQAIGSKKSADIMPYVLSLINDINAGVTVTEALINATITAYQAGIIPVNAKYVAIIDLLIVARSAK